MRNGRAEQRHDTVADKLVYVAFVFADHVGQPGQTPIHEIGDLLGVEFFPQRGKTGDVRKQDGHVFTGRLHGGAGRTVSVGWGGYRFRASRAVFGQDGTACGDRQTDAALPAV